MKRKVIPVDKTRRLREGHLDSLEDSVESIDKSRTAVGQTDGSRHLSQRRIVATISVQRMILDSNVDQREQDSDSHARCGDDGHQGHMVEGPWERDNDYDQ